MQRLPEGFSPLNNRQERPARKRRDSPDPWKQGNNLYATDADGVGVTLGTDGTGRAGHYGTAIAGIAAETIAAGDYGLLQVYGYHSAVRVRSHTGGNPAIAAGTGLASLSAVFCLQSYPAAAAATSTLTLHNAHWCAFALAAQASWTTKAIACFLKCL